MVINRKKPSRHKALGFSVYLQSSVAHCHVDFSLVNGAHPMYKEF
jgi:hypothetical protein